MPKPFTYDQEFIKIWKAKWQKLSKHVEWIKMDQKLSYESYLTTVLDNVILYFKKKIQFHAFLHGRAKRSFY